MKKYVVLLSAFVVSVSATMAQFPSSQPSDKALSVAQLPERVGGTSSLFFMDGLLWTVNDHNSFTLYAIDTITASVVDSIETGASFVDMEEVQQDDNYLYFGDVGNNRGRRANLRILRLAKSSLRGGPFRFDTIAFSYPDFAGDRARDFDCEAFLVTDTALFLFTKQWVSRQCAVYSIPNSIGTHRARLVDSLTTGGMVTGLSYDVGRHTLVLCGYTALCLPFVYMLSDMEGPAFSRGRAQRLVVSGTIGTQIEAVASSDGVRFYLTCEKFNRYGIVVPPQLFLLDLSDFLSYQ